MEPSVASGCYCMIWSGCRLLSLPWRHLPILRTVLAWSVHSNIFFPSLCCCRYKAAQNQSQTFAYVYIQNAAAWFQPAGFLFRSLGALWNNALEPCCVLRFKLIRFNACQVISRALKECAAFERPSFNVRCSVAGCLTTAHGGVYS